MRKRIFTVLSAFLVCLFSSVTAFAWEYPPAKYSSFQSYLDFYRSCDDNDTKNLVAYIDSVLAESPDLAEKFDADAWFEENLADPDLGVTKSNWLAWNNYSNYSFEAEMLNIYLTREYDSLKASISGELMRAYELGLVPDILFGRNMSEKITRAEFAAVAVKVYEAMSGLSAVPVEVNPFLDCTDVNVLKAYGIGAVKGTSATTFEPDALLSREQAAVMLTRVYKKTIFADWTPETDDAFPLQYTKTESFADDEYISAWARDSVYFMAANGIVVGVGEGRFAPRNVTSAEVEAGYANATREQALLIAVRMVDKSEQ